MMFLFYSIIHHHPPHLPPCPCGCPLPPRPSWFLKFSFVWKWFKNSFPLLFFITFFMKFSLCSKENNLHIFARKKFICSHNGLCIYIWVRVEHNLLQDPNLQKNQAFFSQDVIKIVSWTLASKTPKIFHSDDGYDKLTVNVYSTFTMMRVPVKKVILCIFFSAWGNNLHTFVSNLRGNFSWIMLASILIFKNWKEKEKKKFKEFKHIKIFWQA